MIVCHFVPFLSAIELFVFWFNGFWLLQWYHQTFLTLFDFSDKEVNIREYRTGNQKSTIQRNWQHKTKKNKEKHNTICVRHHYTQKNTNSVNITTDIILDKCKYIAHDVDTTVYLQNVTRQVRQNRISDKSFVLF
jgi:hypothetical protein